VTTPSPLERKVAADLFKAEVRRWAAKVGVDLAEIHVRPMSKKWASASSRGRVTFDSSLLTQTPDKRAEVIVHELVHLKVPNHGPVFRSLVRAYLAEGVGEKS
jgi:predicted metal-dependent hydrolase